MKVDNTESDGVSVIIDRDEYVEVLINNVLIMIKHNDVGVSIDTYDNTNKDDNPKFISENQVWFDDFEQIEN